MTVDAIIDAGTPAAERERLVLEFFAEWGKSFEHMCASFQSSFGAQTIWDQRPLPRLRGPASAVRFLSISQATLGLATIDVEIRSVASNTRFTHTERIDRLRRADGSLIAAAPVAGVMEFDGAALIRWREYYDAGRLAAQAALTTLLHPLQGAAAQLTRRRSS